MFAYSAIIFVIAFFAQDLCGSLAKPHNISENISREPDIVRNLAKQERIRDQLDILLTIYDRLSKDYYRGEVDWAIVLKRNVDDYIKVLRHQLDNLLTKDDCHPEKINYTDNFQRIGSRLIYISTNVTLNWISASNACEQMGSRLATFQNKEELQLIVPKLKWDTGYWLDLHDLFKKGRFVSWSTRKYEVFLNWKEGQPDNDNGIERCVELSNNYMYAPPCSAKRYFICEALD